MLVKDRLPAGVVAALGALLTLPSIIWATWSLTIEVAGIEGPLPGQRFWSWGQMEYSTGLPDEANAVETALGSGLAQFTHSAVILVGLVAAATWLLRRGPQGRLLGVAGTTALWVQVLHGLVSRQNWLVTNASRSAPELVAMQTPTGIMETVALVLLTVALSLMLYRPIAATALALWRRVSVRVARMQVDDEEPQRSAPVAVMWDPELGSSPAATPAGEVGFTDAPQDGPDGFGPPRA